MRRSRRRPASDTLAGSSVSRTRNGSRVRSSSHTARNSSRARRLSRACARVRVPPHNCCAACATARAASAASASADSACRDSQSRSVFQKASSAACRNWPRSGGATPGVGSSSRRLFRRSSPKARNAHRLCSSRSRVPEGRRTAAGHAGATASVRLSTAFARLSRRGNHRPGSAGVGASLCHSRRRALGKSSRSSSRVATLKTRSFAAARQASMSARAAAVRPSALAAGMPAARCAACLLSPCPCLRPCREPRRREPRPRRCLRLDPGWRAVPGRRALAAMSSFWFRVG